MEPVLGGLVFQGARKNSPGRNCFSSLLARCCVVFFFQVLGYGQNKNGQSEWVPVYKFMRAYMHTCIHALHTIHTYSYTYTHCSCIKSRSCNKMYKLFSGGSAMPFVGKHIQFHGRNCVPNAQRGTSKAQPQLRIN